MRVIDVCAGIGGMSLGLERAGMTTVAHIEIDPHCRTVLKRHWPGVPRWKDIHHARGSELPTADVVAGGTPCQDWSVAGGRAGIGGSRSGLFFEYARIVEEVKPAWCLWENVPGVLSQHGGADFGTILGVMADLGYHCAWRVLDAQYFGVAQRRRRVFVIGRAGSWPGGAQVLLDPTSGGGDPPARRAQISGVAGAVANGFGEHRDATSLHLTQDPITAEGVAPALGAGNGAGCSTLGVAYGVAENQRAEVLMTEEYLRQLTAGGGKPGQGYGAVMTPELAVRRLTPTECSILQGFPRDWLDDYGSDADEAHAREVLRVMWGTLGSEAVSERRLGSALQLLTPEVLLAGVHGGWISWPLAARRAAAAREVQGPDAWPEGFLRRLREHGAARPSPYRRESFEQLARELGRPLPELPLEAAQAAQALLDAWVRPEASAQRDVRHARSAYEALGGSFNGTGPPRLRLADSHRYRQLGNAVAVPVITWLGKRLMAVETMYRKAP